MVMPRVRTMFKHRTRRILADLTRQQMFKDAPRRRILISGSTGLIGTQLGAFLETDGHDVHRLLRTSTKLHADQNPDNIVRWNDQTGEIIEGSLEGFDVVIHLAGAGIGDKRWSKKRKNLIAQSRSIPTENLSKALLHLNRRRVCSCALLQSVFTITEAMKSWMKQAALAMVSLPKFASNGRMQQFCFECWNPHHSHANRYRYNSCWWYAQTNSPNRQDGCSWSDWRRKAMAILDFSR